MGWIKWLEKAIAPRIFSLFSRACRLSIRYREAGFVAESTTEQRRFPKFGLWIFGLWINGLPRVCIASAQAKFGRKPGPDFSSQSRLTPSLPQAPGSAPILNGGVNRAAHIERRDQGQQRRPQRAAAIEAESRPVADGHQQPGQCA